MPSSILTNPKNLSTPPSCCLFNIFILLPGEKDKDFYYKIAHLLYFLIKKQRKNLNFHERVFIVDEESLRINLSFNCNNSGYYIFSGIESKLQNFLYLVASGSL